MYSVDSADVSVKSKEGKELTSADAQLLSIKCQSGETCAVHSTFNGLKFLTELGDASPAIESQLANHPDSLLRTLLGTSINAEVRERDLEGAGFWRRLFTPSQMENRMAALDQLGVQATQTSNTSEIKRHLVSGRPVILDLDVAYGRQTMVDLNSGGQVQRRILESHTNGGKQELAGGHSVLAVGFIPNGVFSGKLVVLDSGTGSIHLWDWNQVKKASPYGTLLGSNARLREAVFVGKMRDLWRDTATGRVIVGILSGVGMGVGGLAWVDNTYFPPPVPTVDYDEDDAKKKENQHRVIVDGDTLYFVDTDDNVFEKNLKTGKIKYISGHGVERLYFINGKLVAKRRSGAFYERDKKEWHSISSSEVKKRYPNLQH